MKALSTLTLAAIIGLASTQPALANDEHHPSATAQASESTAAMSQGEIKKIDKDAGKITIKHGPLANLDMPPMTMVFRVKEPSMLDQVKPGDKIAFIAEKINGAITVTTLQPAR
jgi:Cu(I)/Ag(I) efflux system periplasmic protein CusF